MSEDEENPLLRLNPGYVTGLHHFLSEGEDTRLPYVKQTNQVSQRYVEFINYLGRIVQMVALRRLYILRILQWSISASEAYSKWRYINWIIIIIINNIIIIKQAVMHTGYHLTSCHKVMLTISIM